MSHLEILAANLRRCRKAAKRTQGDVAEAAGLSRVGYRNIETGAVMPRTESLMRIAQTLDVGLDELLRERKLLEHVRFRAQKRMSSRDELLAEVSHWLDDYNALEELLGAQATYAFEGVAKQFARRKPSPKRATAAAEAAREALGLETGSPIRDICGLLEDHGVKVFAPKLASEGFFGLSVAAAGGGPAVVVNCWDRISVERWIFSAVHELGHLVLHLGAYDINEQAEVAGEEEEANAFASQFLMPDEVFQKEWQEAKGLGFVNRVFKMKRIFRVSWKTVLYRIASETPEPGEIWRRFYGQYKRQFGRSLSGVAEPEALGPDAFDALSGEPASKVSQEPEHLLAHDFVQDRLSRLVRQALDEDKISLGRAAEILRLDLRQMRELVNAWLD